MTKNVVGEIDNIAEQVRPSAGALVKIRKRIEKEIETTNAMKTLTTELKDPTKAVNAYEEKRHVLVHQFVEAIEITTNIKG